MLQHLKALQKSALFLLSIAGVFVTTSTDAAVVKLTAVTDATVSDTDGDGVFESISTASRDRNFGLSVRQFPDLPGIDFADRALIEFDLSPLPTDIVIDTLTFDFRETSFTSDSTTVNILGYTGDGVISLDDATVSATNIGSYSPPSLGLGQKSVALEESLLQSLLDTSQFFGLRLQGGGNVNTSISSLEQPFFNPPPTLTVEFSNTSQSVPEPLTILGSVTALGIGGLLKREHSKKKNKS